ncbi:MAG: hypothetical protein J6T65_02225 [Clostridia bacterium]|nr:hypothetical protein [Clostridia bacterium]MBP5766360.1 hypothetical protein [Clostridia bacterium]
MKRYSMTLLLLMAALLICLVSCKPGGEEPVPTPGDITPVSTPTQEPAETATPTPAPTPEITSAVEFMNKEDELAGWVIDDEIKNADKESLNPGDWFREYLPNYAGVKANLRKLSSGQSLQLLTADDLTAISYRQSEELPLMLDWQDMSTIDVHSFLLREDDGFAYKAFYYYLADSTVIIVNDYAGRVKAAEHIEDKAWIAVIPKGNESAYPFTIPEKGTFITPSSENADSFASYYDELRTYFLKDSGFIPVVVEPTPTPEPTEPPVIEDYMYDYVKWIKWREAHPAEYEEWKQQSFPQKPLSENLNGYSDLNMTKFKIFDLSWCDYYKKEGDTVPVWDAWYATLPYFYRCIKAYDIPKEEFLEYVKWQNWSPSYKEATLDEELVDVLYSGDDDLVRQRFKKDSVIYFEGVLYNLADVYRAVPAYELLRLYSEDDFNELIEMLELDYNRSRYHVTVERVERLKNARIEYEKLKNEDEGPLTLRSAARILSVFMELYRYIRYSPDALAGEPVTYPESGSPDTEYFPYFHFMTVPLSDIEEMALTFLVPELREVYGYMGGGSYREQLHLAEWGSGGSDLDINIVSVNPKYYNGPIELYTDSYTLEDHIRINSADEEHAEVTLTCKNRSGGEDLSYSVEFRKVCGIWHISGGTILDLIEQQHATIDLPF